METKSTIEMRNVLFTLVIFLLSYSLSFSQEVYENGYIVQLKGDTIHGFIKLNNLESYQKQVVFKKGKNEVEQLFLPKDIAEYCIGENTIYRSFEFQLMDSYSVLLDQREHKFLKAITLGKFMFFKYFKHNNTMFYLFTQEEGLVPLKSELDKFKFTRRKNGGIVLESGQVFLNISKGYYLSENKRQHYYYDGEELFVLKNKYNQYLSRLENENGCVDRKIKNDFEKSESNLKRFSKHLYQCKIPYEKYEKVKKKPLFQVSLLGGVAYNSFNSDFGLERKISLEIRENNFSPNVSILIRRSWYNGESIDQPERVEHPRVFVSTEYLRYMYRNPTANTVRLNYHILQGRNFRPYIGSGIKTIHYPFVSIGEDSGERVEVSKGRLLRVIGNIGMDYYFLGFNQVRLEAGYDNGFEVGLSYGVCFK